MAFRLFRDMISSFLVIVLWSFSVSGISFLMRIGSQEVVQPGTENPGHVRGWSITLVVTTEVNDPPASAGNGEIAKQRVPTRMGFDVVLRPLTSFSR